MKTTSYREYIENGRFKIEAHRPGLILAQLAAKGLDITKDSPTSWTAWRDGQLAWTVLSMPGFAYGYSVEP